MTTQKNEHYLREKGKVYKLQAEEKTYAPETHNQTGLRIRDIAAIDVDEQAEKAVSDTYVNLKKELFLKGDGKAHIIFDVHKLKDYSIAVANLNEDAMYVTLSVSPDNTLYAKVIEKKKISENKLEILDCKRHLKNIKISVYGNAGDQATVYLQGYK